MNTQSNYFIVFSILISLFTSSCIPVSEVKAWDKSMLAEPAMAPGGLGKDNALFGHVYTSKEAAKGGEGVSGGGCGCN